MGKNVNFGKIGDGSQVLQFDLELNYTRTSAIWESGDES